eukprot:scaffold8080_cov417-Prasinococcus_capsulatus_cf.AAC.8
MRCKKHAEVLVRAIDVDGVCGQEQSVPVSTGKRGNLQTVPINSARNLDLAVDLDVSLHEDGHNFLVVEGVLQAVSQDQDQRKALTLLVGTRRGLWGKASAKLIKHPRLWRGDALHMLLRSASLAITSSNVAISMPPPWSPCRPESEPRPSSQAHGTRCSTA